MEYNERHKLEMKRLDEIDRNISELSKENTSLMEESRQYIKKGELPPTNILERLQEIQLELGKYSSKLIKLSNP